MKSSTGTRRRVERGAWFAILTLLVAPQTLLADMQSPVTSSDELPGTVLLFGYNGVARVSEQGVQVVVPDSGGAAPPNQAAARAAEVGQPLPGVTVLGPPPGANQGAAAAQGQPQPQQQPQPQAAAAAPSQTCVCNCPPCANDAG